MIRQSLNRCALSLSENGLCSLGLRALERTDRQRNVLRVLMYHRVDRPSEYPHLYPGVHSATPEQFARQLDELQETCNLVTLEQVCEAVSGNSSLPPRAVLVTFDDAYQGFDDYAWPELKKRAIPVVLFVPTNFPDRPEQIFWWDRIYEAFRSTKNASVDIAGRQLALSTPMAKREAAKCTMQVIKSKPHAEAMELVESTCRQLNAIDIPNRVIGWTRLRELAQQGLTLGAHTHTHPLMNRISLEEARVEACRSRDELQARTGVAVQSFAYPAGGCNHDVARMLAEEGFQLAFTTERGINDLQAPDPLRLKRINIGGRTTPNVMRLQLLSYAKYLG